MSGRPPGSEKWPEPRPELLASLHEDIRADRRRRGAPRRRIALATAISLVFLISLAATGGVSYAAGGVREATKAVQKVLDTGSPSSSVGGFTFASQSSSDDEYEEECERQVRLAIRVERSLHREHIAAEHERHREAVAAARSTKTKEDDRAERRLHRQNVRAEADRHRAEHKRLIRELRACDDEDD